MSCLPTLQPRVCDHLDAARGRVNAAIALQQTDDCQPRTFVAALLADEPDIVAVAERFSIRL